MLLLSASALARPMSAPPDLSFKETVLIAPSCTPGTTTTWEIHQEITGSTRGEDIETGEDLSRDIAQTRSNRLTITCLTDSPLTVAITPQWKDGDRWDAAPLSLTYSVPSGAAPVLTAPTDPDVPGASWRSTITGLLPFIFPPMAASTPEPGATWDGAWPIDLGPWWDCHGAVTAGEKAGMRAYTLAGRCENISYWGTNRLTGTFTRPDGGFGVQEATWSLSSLWEHYMIYTDTDTVVTVTRVPSPRASPGQP